MSTQHASHSLRQQFMADADKSSKYEHEIMLVGAARVARRDQYVLPASYYRVGSSEHVAITSILLMRADSCHQDPPPESMPFDQRETASEEPAEGIPHHNDQIESCQQDIPDSHHFSLPSVISSGREATSCQDNRSSTISYVQHDHGTLSQHLNTTLRVANVSTADSETQERRNSNRRSDPLSPFLLVNDDPDFTNLVLYTPNHSRSNRDSTISYIQHDHGALQPYYNAIPCVANVSQRMGRVPAMSRAYEEKFARDPDLEAVFDGTGPITQLYSSRFAKLTYDAKKQFAEMRGEVHELRFDSHAYRTKIWGQGWAEEIRREAALESKEKSRELKAKKKGKGKVR